mmetsp:Transcript_5615/g.13378  ORF Transcript_5615/g.13378 Transcript_5615/m.13378 type:complete len:216 (+) Transcript_5615:3-650(+)
MLTKMLTMTTRMMTTIMTMTTRMMKRMTKRMILMRKKMRRRKKKIQRLWEVAYREAEGWKTEMILEGIDVVPQAEAVASIPVPLVTLVTMITLWMMTMNILHTMTTIDGREGALVQADENHRCNREDIPSAHRHNRGVSRHLTRMTITISFNMGLLDLLLLDTMNHVEAGITMIKTVVTMTTTMALNLVHRALPTLINHPRMMVLKALLLRLEIL